ncbi:dtdp-glucose 4,6-dehydratase [Paramyrothecium foliicola]|nr:dtdp-glucose 4,6-dehydratase [Paramyrothecium foliicola]
MTILATRSITLQSPSSANGQNWKRAPLLQGTTKFKPSENVRNIIVTGGAGFIGSWVVRHLALTYADVYNIICFDRIDYCSSINNVHMLCDIPNYAFVRGYITLSKDVMDCLQTYNIDTVIHFAAQSHVDLSFQNPDAFIRDNVQGTNVLLESARKVGIRRFIHVSTDEVYGEVPYEVEDLHEDSLLAPSNPYAASKAAAEMMTMAYARSFQLPIIIVRLNNVYGPHQFPEKVIPKFISLLQRNRKLMVHGDGKNSRRYLWAGDATDAFDTVLHKGIVGQIYNVGSQDEITTLELCNKLIDIFGLRDSQRWISFAEDRLFNDFRYAINDTKLQKLGWKQQVSFEDGLRRTVEWYRDFPNWWGDITHVLAG